MTTRGKFLKATASVALLPLVTLPVHRTMAAEKVPVDDPTAKALKYVEDATTATRAGQQEESTWGWQHGGVAEARATAARGPYARGAALRTAAKAIRPGRCGRGWMREVPHAGGRLRSTLSAGR